MQRCHVWQYFSKLDSDESKVKCKLCPQILSCGGKNSRLYNTMNVSKHLLLNYCHAVASGLTEVVSSGCTLEGNGIAPEVSSFKLNNNVVQSKPKQQTMKDAFSRHEKFKSTDAKAQVIIKAVGEIIVLVGLQFSMVEGQGFQKLMAVIEKKIHNLKDTMDDFMSLTVRFLHGPRDVHLYLDALPFTNDHHDANSVAEFVNDSLATWGLTGKVTAIVRDSAPNLRLAMEKKLKKDILRELEKLFPSKAPGESSSTSLLPIKMNDTYVLATCLDPRLLVKLQATAKLMKLEYLREPVVERSRDIYEYWHNNTKYLTLKKLALKYLCIPASSFESERLFSTCSFLVNNRSSKSRKSQNVDVPEKEPPIFAKCLSTRDFVPTE
ncbi:hypothetical protein PR048_020018 [Dryococelus australis]|uniref:BED-type domain-containing protein n=1 Tax=Dryococelus australis TaxID=614101 RepID=A0ABQ9H549_9NEOP|nr:hypothetical protein PR048_020018 [Dryococelus australis]